MSAATSRLTVPATRALKGRATLRRFAPIALPLVIVAAAWMLLVEPRRAAARRAETEIRTLEPRLASLSPLVDAPAIPVEDGPAAADVIRRLPQVDPMPDVLERLARLALVGANDADEQRRVSYLLIETGDQAVTGGETGAGPRASRGDEPDPRFALFGVPLAFTRVTVSFESTYERLGQFLWDMRELPTIVEVHALEIKPASADGARLKTSMVLFVYRRLGQGPGSAGRARGPA